MMDDGFNPNLKTGNQLTDIITPNTFISLDKNLQDKILDTMGTDMKKDGGTMGSFLGVNPTNVSLHIGLIICLCLLLLLFIDFLHSYAIGIAINMELVNMVFPVVTLALGYIFGKGAS